MDSKQKNNWRGSKNGFAPTPNCFVRKYKNKWLEIRNELAQGFKRKSLVRGFTLAELLTVCAIIGIMTIVVLVSQQNTKAMRNLEATGRAFAAAVRELQNNALSGKQMGNLNTTVVCGYGFTTTAGGSTYSLYYNSYAKSSGTDCSSAPKNFVSGTSTLYLTGSFGNNVVSTNASSAYFSIPDSNLYDSNGNLASSLPALNLSLSYSSAYIYPICIYNLGRLEEPGIGGSCP